MEDFYLSVKNITDGIEIELIPTNEHTWVSDYLNIVVKYEPNKDGVALVMSKKEINDLPSLKAANIAIHMLNLSKMANLINENVTVKTPGNIYLFFEDKVETGLH